MICLLYCLQTMKQDIANFGLQLMLALVKNNMVVFLQKNGQQQQAQKEDMRLFTISMSGMVKNGIRNK